MGTAVSTASAMGLSFSAMAASSAAPSSTSLASPRLLACAALCASPSAVISLALAAEGTPTTAAHGLPSRYSSMSACHASQGSVLSRSSSGSGSTPPTRLAPLASSCDQSCADCAAHTEVAPSSRQ